MVGFSCTISWQKTITRSGINEGIGFTALCDGYLFFPGNTGSNDYDITNHCCGLTNGL